MTVLRLAFVAVFAVTACTASDDQAPSGPVGETVSNQLRHMASVSPQHIPIEHELYQLDADSPDVDAQLCNRVQGALNSACQLLTAAGVSDYCSAQASFFLANTTPRCGARVELLDEAQIAPGGTPLPTIFAFDLSGTPIADRVPTCGDGVVDDGEECDDGNHDVFDGCDSQCFLEPFNGCEGIIQSYFQAAQIATIEQALWVGPRSHIMVHNATKPMRPIDQAACNAAAATAVDACNEMVHTMPHVGSCAPSTQMFNDELGDACAVRFSVYFSAIDPSAGAYTTELPGILAFTLR